MSPVSRDRKGKKYKKSSQRRPARPDVFSVTDECDCPSCSGADFDPQRLIDELVTGAGELVEDEDPLNAEVVGAAFVSIESILGEVFEEALVEGFIPQFEARASTEALAILLAIGSVAQGRAGKAASTAADRLVEAGIPRPAWAAELGEPVTVSGCLRLIDSQDTGSTLVCTLHRAGRSHAVVITVDHLDCGAASDILLFDADQLPEALEMMRAVSRDSGVDITAEVLDAAEFRWQVEKALDARAVHDAGDLTITGTADMPVEEDGPGYPALAVLLRARMTALPLSSKPPAPHGNDSDRGVGLTALQMLAQRAGNAARPRDAVLDAGAPIALRGRTTVAAQPAKRQRSGQSARIYQIKVSLQGAKPPIWRRLEVPADISLDRLHTIIQVAFDWHDSHLHVFETPYGNFGIADAELGHSAEAPVTLKKVAPAANSKLRYTYDFGDDWEHDIVVEKVLDRNETVAYPRCTAGRRAAPPEDCGGIWGYADLVRILNDPADPEHRDRLEWLGLDDAADFDPDSFDADAVTSALSALR
jgi:Plasmid pRiA4b ORF-3-like protein